VHTGVEQAGRMPFMIAHEACPDAVLRSCTGRLESQSYEEDIGSAVDDSFTHAGVELTAEVELGTRPR
jgi:hypothetical protein